MVDRKRKHGPVDPAEELRQVTREAREALKDLKQTNEQVLELIQSDVIDACRQLATKAFEREFNRVIRGLKDHMATLQKIMATKMAEALAVAGGDTEHKHVLAASVMLDLGAYTFKSADGSSQSIHVILENKSANGTREFGIGTDRLAETLRGNPDYQTRVLEAIMKAYPDSPPYTYFEQDRS